jgi:hypothetical protein
MTNVTVFSIQEFRLNWQAVVIEQRILTTFTSKQIKRLSCRSALGLHAETHNSSHFTIASDLQGRRGIADRSLGKLSTNAFGGLAVQVRP